MAESVSAARYYCHQCSTDINPNEDFTCPTCASGFIEVMDERFEEEQFHENFANSMNSMLSQLMPRLRRDAGSREIGGVFVSEGEEGQPRSIRGRRRRPDESQRLLLVMDTMAPQASSSAARTERRSEDQPSQSGADDSPNILQSPAGLDSLVQQLINNLLGNTAGFPNPESLFVHGNPGDYVFGQSAFDNIVTQLMNQLEPTGPPPASPQQINALNTISITQDQIDDKLQCSICLELFELSDKVIKLPCTHYYHAPCIKPWLEKHCTCPICRKTLNGEDHCNSDSRPDGGRPFFDLHRQ